MIKLEDYDFQNKRALVRVDFNVPLDKTQRVTDATRILKAAPTIKTILKKGGSVVLMSHLGRPKGKADDAYSLRHVVETLKMAIDSPVDFADDCIGPEAREKSSKLQPGDVLLLENLRFHKEETEGDEYFAGQLAEHGDCYVNDAFGTAHRAHASTATIANFFPTDKMFGLLLREEIDNLERMMNSDDKPVVAIIGGAKVSSKITVLQNLLDKVDHIIVGGGMAFTFIKAQGGKVGNSMVEDDFIETAKELLEAAKNKGVDIHLPTDAVIADDFREDASTDVCPANDIPDGWMGLDIGPETIQAFSKVISQAKVILWNGPMGVFEMDAFSRGTSVIAKCVADTTESHYAYSLVGGGDSVAAIHKFGREDDVSYVSTGGGAMLEYLEGKTLPGIAAIMD